MAQKYRMLKSGEIIKKGDQYLSNETGYWVTLIDKVPGDHKDYIPRGNIGERWDISLMDYRRPLSNLPSFAPKKNKPRYSK